MSQASHTDETQFGDRESADATYQPFSPLAIVAIVLGGVVAGLGIVALIASNPQLLVIVPLLAALGVLFALLALRSIRASGGIQAGDRLAVAGLFLSLFFGTLVYSQEWVHQLLLRREARQVAEAFFELLAADQPQKAIQLTVPPGHRQPAGSDLWEYYRTTPPAYDGLRTFVDQPIVQALLALQDKAQVAYVMTEELNEDHGQAYVGQIYTVTYETDGRRVTFYTRVGLQRHEQPETGKIGWLVGNIEGGVRPYVRSKVDQ